MVVLPLATVAPAAMHALAATKEGRVLGWGARAGYLQLDAFVMAVTPAGTPLMPNGVSLGIATLPPISGSQTWVEAGRIRMRGISLVWDPAAPPSWDPRVRSEVATPEAVEARGRAIAEVAGGLRLDVDPGLFEAGGTGTLLQGADVLVVAREILGRGPGLTPEGDDVLAGAVATVRAFGGACGLDPDRWVAPFEGLDLDGVTSGLSATLLRLALRGHVIQPVRSLLNLSHRAPSSAVERLLRVGHSTGRAYAAAIAGTAVALAATARA